MLLLLNRTSVGLGARLGRACASGCVRGPPANGRGASAIPLGLGLAPIRQPQASRLGAASLASSASASRAGAGGAAGNSQVPPLVPVPVEERSKKDVAAPPERGSASQPVVTATMFDPSETWDKIVKVGAYRAHRPNREIFVSSFLAGSFLSFGGALYFTVAGGSPWLQEAVPGFHTLLCAMVFPVGLHMIVLSGTDLLTSNMMYGAMPYYSLPSRSAEEKTQDLLRLWSVSLAGNLAGSLVMAVAASAWLFTPGSTQAAFITALAAKKTGLSLGAMVGKATLANWLVNVAIYQAATAQTTAGKMAGLWLPITTFVALGLEHSIANMFTLPLARLLSENDTPSILEICGNWGPVLLGNTLGATLFVGGLQWYASGGLGRVKK